MLRYEYADGKESTPKTALNTFMIVDVDVSRPCSEHHSCPELSSKLNLRMTSSKSDRPISAHLWEYISMEASI